VYAVYGKVGSVASEEVIVQLLKAKCVAVVLSYSLNEACPLNKSDLKSLDYVLFSSFSKIFHTESKDVIDQCMSLFGCPPVIAVVNKHKVKFLADYVKSFNTLCMLFACVAQEELDALAE